MLRQIDIYTKADGDNALFSDLSVKIHGYMMSRIGKEKAEEYHKKSLRPFSLYTVDAGEFFITRVATLQDEAAELISLFESTEKIRIFGLADNLRIIRLDRAPDADVATLAAALSGEKYRLDVLTPAQYRSGGVLCHNPELPKYFQSVAAKLSLYEGVFFSKEQIEAAFQSIKINSYSLKSASFKTGGHGVKGMIGYVDIDFTNADDSAKTLLAYATYSGIGGGTAQGMGGIILTPLQN